MLVVRLRNQGVELAPYVAGGKGDVPARAVVPEQQEPQLAADDLLVALKRGPRPLAVDPHRLGAKDLLHLADVPAGQAQCGEQAERDSVAVRDALVAGRRLERVRERVAEVQHLPLPLVVRVAQAERRLARGAAADELAVAELPEGFAREQAGLHDLRETFTSLRRSEERRVGK